jgi:hypothetical protein
MGPSESEKLEVDELLVLADTDVEEVLKVDVDVEVEVV